MATTIYLESTGTPAISPTPDATWTDTAQFTRYDANSVKAGSTMVDVQIFGTTNGQKILIGQWISSQLTPGQTITGSQSVSLQMLFMERISGDNQFFSWAVKIYNGTTLQKTVIVYRADTTEFSTAYQSRTDSTTSSAGNYTTVSGDRLVIEIGFEQGGNDASGYCIASIGSASASDVPSNNTTSTISNPNLILTDTLTFSSGSSDSRMSLLGIN